MTSRSTGVLVESNRAEPAAEPRRRGRPLVIAGIVLVAVLAVVATVSIALTPGAGPRRAGQPARGGLPDASPAPAVPAIPGSAKYARAVDVAARHGMRVWIETDLVKRWQAGPASFNGAIQKVAALAHRPGVAGIKFADELGYEDGLNTVAKVRAFLTATGVALHQAAPGKLLLADILVPELGCVPTPNMRPLWATVCGVHTRGDYPQLALPAVDGYMAMGVIDVLDLSTGLQNDRTYAGWGTDRDSAQRAAWQEALRRGWNQHAKLQARKALAHPGAYTGSTRQAAADLKTWVDIPLATGAAAVDVWTWRQGYEGAVNRLQDPGMRSNALWAGLVARHRTHATLFTHFTPSSMERGLEPDLAAIATAFTDLFVAAGTG